MCGEHHVIGHILVHYWGENLQGNWWSSGPAFSSRISCFSLFDSAMFVAIHQFCRWNPHNPRSSNQKHNFSIFFPRNSQVFYGVFTIFPRNLPTFPSPEAPSLTVPGGAAAPRGAAELCLALRRGAEGTAAARRRTLDIPETLDIYWLSIMYSNRWCNHNNNL